MHTFYLEAESFHAPFILSDKEFNHLSKVLRLKKGEDVTVIDGAGKIGTFKIAELNKKNCTLIPIEIIEQPKPKGGCTLALSYTKALRRSWIMEKAVELEAGGIWFWQSERSQAKIPDEASEAWQDQMIAGAKQSQNPWIPELRVIKGIDELIDLAKSFSKAYILWEDEDKSNVISEKHLSCDKETLFVLGPEGGLSPKEVDKFKAAGFESISLGNRILRWETAAMLTLSLNFWNRQLKTSQEI